MNRQKSALRFVAASMASLLFALSTAAQAEAYLTGKSGSGPNDYRSREISGYADLFDTPLSVNAFSFKSSSSGATNTTQYGIGMDWKISELAKLGISHDVEDNGSIDNSGNALNLALSLNTLWNSDLQTRVDLKAAKTAYRFSDLPPAVRNDTINQTAYGFGVTQDINEWLSLNAGHDQYSYDRDPLHVALFLMRLAPRRFINTSTSLQSFPDVTNQIGLTLRPLEPLTLSFSFSKTTTQLDQELKTGLVGIDYQVTEHLNLYVALSRVSSTAVVTKQPIFPGIPAITIPAGTTIMPATDDRYTEFSLGWTF